ncbi:MAG: hypothetical protein J7L16_04610 [Deltaproteobacteria bacterium]|nr:hypothetical protein [Deltaproteobacteria bacterium]
MKASIVFTGTGPILILTSYETITNPNLIKKMSNKGIKKFVSYEIDIEKVKEKYGNQFNVIMGDLDQTDDLRVLDYNGHNVFYNFSFEEMGTPTYHES